MTRTTLTGRSIRVTSTLLSVRKMNSRCQSTAASRSPKSWQNAAMSASEPVQHQDDRALRIAAVVVAAAGMLVAGVLWFLVITLGEQLLGWTG